ncbi:hypothetical protein ZIOFF_018044 [Zingiber officinale]|uniref:Uncharacterized protein n=1 Tax=Zingiber officinale TaxID=94328 RepID=A0A8J5LLT7_ZINOF|nr:hypothetical protein ZIOFF_018044 [Zingiber officinale]
MENQLPFFVLQKIYDLATSGTPVAGSPTLKDKVDRTIKKLLPCYPLVTAKEDFHHLLHCCYLKFKPAKANSSSCNRKPMANGSSSNGNPTDELEPWRGAMDLYKAGIKFKRKKCNDSESLLDVEFSKRTIDDPDLDYARQHDLCFPELDSLRGILLARELLRGLCLLHGEAHEDAWGCHFSRQEGNCRELYRSR